MVLSYFILPAVILGLVGVRAVLRWNKLRKNPGPFLAGFTDLWRTYHQHNGTLRERLLELHAKHGPVVRYGPNSISISDPEVINVVYGSRAGFITGEAYRVLSGRQNGQDIPSLVSTRDEKKHAALRRSVANAFTPNASLDYEEWIDLTIHELLQSVSKKSEFDVSAMMLWYTMDAAARFSFGNPLGCLAAEGDVGGSVQVIKDRLNHWAYWMSYPGVERLVHRNPIYQPSKRGPSSMVAAATARLEARLGVKGGLKNDKEVAGHTDLLDRFLEAREDFPVALNGSGIVSMLMSTISGAGDTTATTISAMLFLLLKNPETLKKLEAELTDAGIREVPAFAEVGKLPYLNAVVRETMRVYTAITFPMERLVPEGGAEIAGTYFPAGTSVGCLPAAVHANKRVYGDDVDVFRPERWLTEDREQLRLMEASHMGFSRGRRACLGQNIAVMSIKKVVPALLMKFQLNLVDPDASLGVDASPAIAAVLPIHVTSRTKG
ncbi:cytochrome P450 [Astrocystis sublimbata]|nr:cytochrome P450 [Astrocystis sublimbata]